VASRGRIYKRGNTWWLAYSHRGKEYRESSGSSKKADANELLNSRLGDIVSNRFVGHAERKLTFDDLTTGYLRDYDLRRLRSKEIAELRVRHLRSFFGEGGRLRNCLAIDIGADLIRQYQEFRSNEDAEAATVNREVAALRRMFAIALKNGRMRFVPPFPDKLEENPPRQGFFEHNEYLAVRVHLRPEYQDVLDFAYYSGWRSSEIKKLAWAEVDLQGRVIRLDPGRSKNKKGRPLPLSGQLFQVIERRVAQRRIDTPRVFHYGGGNAIGDFRKAWRNACTKAGLPGKYLHDCRRTVARNLIRAGVPETVAMGITGHKTRAVFDRYNITAEKELREAMDRLTDYVADLPTEPDVVPMEAVRNAPLDSKTRTIVRSRRSTGAANPCEWRGRRDSNSRPPA